MKHCITFLAFLSIVWLHQEAKAQRSSYYEVKIYTYKTAVQEERLDAYLKDAWLPAMHAAGFQSIGVFKPIENDTAAQKRTIIILSAHKLAQLAGIEEQLAKEDVLKNKGADYLATRYNNAIYDRIERVWLKAFKMAPKVTLPVLTTPLKDHVYELRSYESPSESYYRNKVHMFNEGGEVDLFKSLGFNAVFYGDVLAGAHQPNLMYMTSFENMDARNAHWKAFSASPLWKKISTDPYYANNVSKNVTLLMRATDYSDY